MRVLAFALFLALVGGLVGCKSSATASTTSTPPPANGGGGAAMPDVGAVTPVTGVSLDSAAGGGVNSAAMKKAKKVAGEGVGSLNSAQKSGEGMGEDGG